VINADFASKTALVTGAASGIGRATAEAVACHGGAVALVDRDGVEAHTVAAAIVARGGRALALAADVADRAAVDGAVAACVAEFGGLDVLVNNAGIHFARAIDEYTEDEIDRILSVNVKGAFHVIRAALPALRKARGTIVSVSSMTGLVGQDRGAVYVATKGALISLTKALAIELAPDGIRVNCVCPAGVDTPLMRGWAETLPDPAAVLRGQAAMHLMNRMATADEIAAGIMFLVSPAASFITGTTLQIDGGATLGYRRS
jgi:NAD(P)-dependent dehydrogenase (short-subunit alcohol dehydrogenase family)